MLGNDIVFAGYSTVLRLILRTSVCIVQKPLYFIRQRGLTKSVDEHSRSHGWTYCKPDGRSLEDEEAQWDKFGRKP